MKLMAQSTKIRRIKGRTPTASLSFLVGGIPARKWRLRILDKDEGVTQEVGQKIRIQPIILMDEIRCKSSIDKVEPKIACTWPTQNEIQPSPAKTGKPMALQQRDREQMQNGFLSGSKTVAIIPIVKFLQSESRPQGDDLCQYLAKREYTNSRDSVDRAFFQKLLTLFKIIVTIY